jgi:hypothetical protein
MFASALITTLISALVPVGVEGIKQAITTKLGGVKATTVDEQIKLDQNEINKLEALAKLDNPGGTPSQWVVDLRASARYLGAIGVIAAGIGSIFIPGIDATVKIVALDAANIAFGFLFGTRIVASWKK